MDTGRISGKPLVAIAAGFFILINGLEPARAEKFKGQDRSPVNIRDNSHRQIAALSPGLKKDKKVDPKVDPKVEAQGFEATISSYRKRLVGELESHNIPVEIPEIDVPDNMEMTLDVCFKTVRSACVFTQEHTGEFAGWLARYVKQLTGPPKITPISSPYDHGQRLVASPATPAETKLFLTEGGRLKTVTNR